jgi:protein-tyrosine-phosphatase
MAAALFEVATRDVTTGRGHPDAGHPVSGEPVPVVASAGLLESGRPVVPEVVAALVPYGVDLAGHRSTRVTKAALESADLVLGMERRHGREAILLLPAAWPRTFTVKDLVHRGEKVGPRSSGEPLRDWLAVVGEGRERTSLIGRSPEDEVADPLGGSPAHYAATAAELADLVDRLTGLLWPRATGGGRSGGGPSGPGPGVPIAE